MNRTTLLLALAIPFSGLIGFFIGRSLPSKAQTSQTAVAQKLNSSPESKATKDGEAIAVTVGNEETSTTDRPNEEIAEIETKIEPVKSLNPALENIVLQRVNSGISDKKISSILESIAENMEKQKLAYVSNLGQDCSGIFHKVKDSLQARLPALAQSATFEYPLYNSERSSRQIANWYHKNNNLLIVEDPVASRNSIRPGSVMFFAKPNKRFKNMTIEQLTDNQNNFTSNGYIMHIAIVTSVRTDENGDVVDYTMMHGRNSRHPASRTGSKEVQSKRTKDLPPFGNWSQQWVAVANVMTAR